MAINEELYFGFEQLSDEALATTSQSGRPAGGGGRGGGTGRGEGANERPDLL
jgi:hypothetical protein